MSELENKVALITGGSRGIGFAIAQELVRHGARVAITGRSADDLDDAVKKLGETNALGIAGSSDDPQHREEAASATREGLGPIDILVNNAGTNPQYGPLESADLGAIAKVFNVNLLAPIGWVQEAVRCGLREQKGVVLNIASLGGIRAGTLAGAYNVSKAGLIHLTRQLAVELAPDVRVNAMAPAIIKTSFSRVLYEPNEDEVASSYPLKRLGTPEDTADLAVFLISDRASWITGETVVIDGGAGLVA